MNENLKKFIFMLNEEQKKQSQTATAQEHVEPQQPTLIETVSAPVISSSLSGPELLAARLSKKPIVEEQTDSLVPLNQKFVTFKEMNDHYGLFLQRIQQQLASLGGGGEVKFARLDDINRSSVGTNKYLTYNSVTGKFDFTAVATGEGIELDGNNRVALSVATTTILGGIKLGPGVELNGLDQIVINPEGLDFSFGDFYAYTAPGPNGNTAAYLSSINDNEDIIIASNGTGQVGGYGKKLKDFYADCEVVLLELIENELEVTPAMEWKETDKTTRSKELEKARQKKYQLEYLARRKAELEKEIASISKKIS